MGAILEEMTKPANDLVFMPQMNAMSYIPVTVDTVTLLQGMKRSEVFVCRPSSPDKRATFYRSVLPIILVKEYLIIDDASLITETCYRKLWKLRYHRAATDSFISRISSFPIYRIKVALSPALRTSESMGRCRWHGGERESMSSSWGGNAGMGQ